MLKKSWSHGETNSILSERIELMSHTIDQANAGSDSIPKNYQSDILKCHYHGEGITL
jgi:hypothetical protein